ncbi:MULTISPECIES: SDR family oxidoreductase [Agrobacterium tumefaciens complex]|jgi:NAD(P)-dependent dehydrogenase (short-subunit alcohol dehydrogenase family)|uniref:NAD(P)-dependent dehydrogenase (Short-subunit alcohol dehydrogenase family) n=2 Tax=Agrobacterium tumefaciens complex TaxID=1183400 RepID=A0AAW8M1N9_AGRTU|nr:MULTISPECIES: SDR family oxidoreductase [Agrobacterium tumefaciens complex]EPR18605.1 short-chain dehydrogenase [Agrobacterium radiobacter DSM 30147]KAB0455413.1 SDR family oxidoreductase [Agrobacterium tumefaciens]KWT78840.1 short-chain dehydrogenase [Agrobacterium radiobacter]MBB4321523.1 NAD(P)-dependent dehydrogenase (short-subunit alcohol dehydrogenase family) [Agrobacterium radiobacter]MBB4338563.1 NAD(P)-dependent dehydrogenase (short-subunit alcohol dehydrogenase family) [Agrobacter
MTDHSIKGKTVIIAGGAKNLGGLIARDLAAHGAKAIAIHYNSAGTKAEAEATVAAVKAAGGEAVTFQADLTTAGAVEKLFADTIAAIGKPDIAINTVGKVLKKPMIDISEAEYDEMTAVNAKTAFFFIKEAGKHLNDNGKICTLVTSLLGAFTPFYAAYAGTKAPVEHFTRAASKEFGQRGISVTAIGPGPMDTPFFYPAEGSDAVAYHKTAAALSKFSKTGLTDIEDIVPYIRFMVSEGWWMTGQTILVNGGYTTK